MTSFSVVSLMAMVPERECRIPTLMVPVAWAAAGEVAALTAPTAARVAAATPRRPRPRRERVGSSSDISACFLCLLLFRFPRLTEA